MILSVSLMSYRPGGQEAGMYIEGSNQFRLEKLFDLSAQLTEVSVSRLPAGIYDDLSQGEVVEHIWDIFQRHLKALMDLTSEVDEVSGGTAIPATPDQVRFFVNSHTRKSIWLDPVFLRLWDQYLADPASLTGKSMGVLHDAGALLAAYKMLKEQG
jgi:hypothetical protein